MTIIQKGERMSDLISRQDALEAFCLGNRMCLPRNSGRTGTYVKMVMDNIKDLPAVQLETCEGCKHLGKWENEVEYGYPSPCTRCKRRVEDHYER